MKYLYMTCKDIGIELMKKQFFKKYGVHIDSSSLYEDEFAEKVKTLFQWTLEEAKRKYKPVSVIKDAYDRLHSNEKSTDVEQEHLEIAIRDLETIISHYENYTDDLAADILMGLLWADSKNDIDFKCYVEDEETGELTNVTLAQVWGRDNRLEDGNEKYNYPYANIRKFPSESIPGGCKKYHEVLMDSDNIVIFEVPVQTKNGMDLRKYTYPKMDILYQKMINSPIENIVLLERSLGIGCTNVWFSYLKNVENMGVLGGYEKIIKRCGDIEPMFLRHWVIKVVCEYLYAMNKKTDNAGEVAGYLIDFVADIIKLTYDKIFDYVWGMYYLAYWTGNENSKEELLEDLRERVSRRWREYYTDSETYQIFFDEYNQYNWRAGKSIDEYFETIDESNDWNVDLFNKVEAVGVRWKNGSTLCFMARKPLPGLGEKIRAMAIGECCFEWIEESEPSEQDKEQMRTMLYEKERSLLANMRKRENKLFLKKDCKLNKDKATHNNVYAYIHLQVIRNSLL